MKGLAHTLALLGVALGGATPAGGAPAPTPAPAPAPPEVKLAPPGEAGSEVRSEMKKILSGRDYRQLRREALRAKKKKEEPPPRKDCGDDDRKGCQGCRGCEGCEGGGAGAGGGGVGSLASGLMYLVVMLAVAFLIGLIAWTIARHWKKERTDDDEDLLDEEALAPSTPPGEHPSSEYLRKALALSSEGDHRGAIRQLLLGCMSWIERNGLIRYRKGLTNRDYLRAVFRRQTQAEGMGGIVTEFERIYFGRRAATAEGFKQCLSGFQAGFKKDEGEAEMAR